MTRRSGRNSGARCRAIRPDAYLVGEIWEVAPDWVGDDGFDALMDYPLGEAILGFVGGPSLDMGVVHAHHEYRRHLRPLDGPGFATRLDELLGVYDPDVVAVQLNLIGSHDAPRALAVLGGDLAALRMATLLQCTAARRPVHLLRRRDRPDRRQRSGQSGARSRGTRIAGIRRSTRYVRSLLRLRAVRAGLAARVDDRPRRGRRGVRLRAAAGRWAPRRRRQRGDGRGRARRVTRRRGPGTARARWPSTAPSPMAPRRLPTRPWRSSPGRLGCVVRRARRLSCVSRTEADRPVGRVALYSRPVADLPIDLDAPACPTTRRGTGCRGQAHSCARRPRSDQGTRRGPRRRCRRTSRSTAQRPRRTSDAGRLEWSAPLRRAPRLRRCGRLVLVGVPGRRPRSGRAGPAAAAARRPIARGPRLWTRRRRWPARRAARVQHVEPARRPLPEPRVQGSGRALLVDVRDPSRRPADSWRTRSGRRGVRWPAA